jgi:acetylornithine deacetylase
MKQHPPKVRFVGYDAEASEIPRRHPVVETVSRNYKAVTGRDPEISGRQGAADTRFLNRYADTPTVIFGPGGAGAHAIEERVNLDDCEHCIELFVATAKEFCA